MNYIKLCFACDATCSDSKYLAISDKVLKDKAYEIAISTKYDKYHIVLVSVVYKFLDKKTGLGVTNKTREKVNEVLAQELDKPVIK